jgi:hypothetical protein
VQGKEHMTNTDFRELLNYYPRLRDWYEIGPLQRTELEAFVNAALQAGITAVTADGELVSPGDTVWVFSSTGKITPTTVLKQTALSNYYLHGNVPVAESFSTEQAALNYKKYNQ